MSDTIYCGSGKKIESQYGIFRSITVCLTNLPEEHTFEYNGKKYIKLNINDKKEADQFGKDVSVSVNTYKPDKEGKPIPKDQPVVNPPLPEKDDLPF